MKRLTPKSIARTIEDTIEEFHDFAVMENRGTVIVVENGNTKIKITVTKMK